MILESFAVGPLGCNCTIVADETTGAALVVDPGGDLEKITSRLSRLGVKPKAIVHTHTHIDHVGATAGLQRATDAAARIHEGDHFLLQILPMQAQLVGMRLPGDEVQLDAWLRDDETLSIGSIAVRVLHTPGHSPGSCCFEVRPAGAGDEGVVLLAGDTLFQGSVGRTDLWGGDFDSLASSIKQRLFSLPDPTRVICGHGPDTQVGVEKRSNPFVGQRAR